jgi:hypothetical protein
LFTRKIEYPSNKRLRTLVYDNDVCVPADIQFAPHGGRFTGGSARSRAGGVKGGGLSRCALVRLPGGAAMSALPPKADMRSALGNVRFVPIADITSLIRSPRRLWQGATAEWSGRAPLRS